MLAQHKCDGENNLAVFDGAVYPATAWAEGGTHMLVWSREAMQALLRTHPVPALNALQLVSERLREVQERFRELASERVVIKRPHGLVAIAEGLPPSRPGGERP